MTGLPSLCTSWQPSPCLVRKGCSVSSELSVVPVTAMGKRFPSVSSSSTLGEGYGHASG